MNLTWQKIIFLSIFLTSSVFAIDPQTDSDNTDVHKVKHELVEQLVGQIKKNMRTPRKLYILHDQQIVGSDEKESAELEVDLAHTYILPKDTKEIIEALKEVDQPITLNLSYKKDGLSDEEMWALHSLLTKKTEHPIRLFIDNNSIGDKKDLKLVIEGKGTLRGKGRAGVEILGEAITNSTRHIEFTLSQKDNFSRFSSFTSTSLSNACRETEVIWLNYNCDAVSYPIRREAINYIRYETAEQLANYILEKKTKTPGKLYFSGNNTIMDEKNNAECKDRLCIDLSNACIRNSGIKKILEAINEANQPIKLSLKTCLDRSNNILKKEENLLLINNLLSKDTEHPITIDLSSNGLEDKADILKEGLGNSTRPVEITLQENGIGFKSTASILKTRKKTDTFILDYGCDSYDKTESIKKLANYIVENKINTPGKLSFSEDGTIIDEVNENGLCVALSSKCIGDEELKIIAESLKKVEQPMELRFAYNIFETEGAKVLKELIEKFKWPIKLFRPSYFPNEDEETKILSEGIKKSKAPFIHLELGGNDYYGEKYFMAAARDTTQPFTLLFWSYNLDSTLTADTIKNKKHSAPLLLDIIANDLNEGDGHKAKLLAEAIEKSTFPLALWLEVARVGDREMEMFSKAIINRNSSEPLDLSIQYSDDPNLTCEGEKMLIDAFKEIAEKNPSQYLRLNLALKYCDNKGIHKGTSFMLTLDDLGIGEIDKQARIKEFFEASSSSSEECDV